MEVNVDLTLLRSFVAVAEELHFSAAAERLHVAQPALSRRIQALERSLGIALFVRDRRNVSLTDAGQALLAPFQHQLAEFDEAVEVARELDLGRRKVLRVGFASANQSPIASSASRGFGRACPGWRITMIQSPWSDPTSGVATGLTDVGISRLPVLSDDLEEIPLLEEPHWVAMPSNHRLAEQTYLDLGSILDEPLVTVPAMAGTWRDRWLLVTFRPKDRPAKIAAEVSTPDEWFSAISAGLGIAITPRSSARFYARPGIAYRPLPDAPPSRLGLLRRHGDRRPAVTAFIDAAIEGTSEAAELLGAGVVGGSIGEEREIGRFER